MPDDDDYDDEPYCEYDTWKEYDDDHGTNVHDYKMGTADHLLPIAD